MEKYWRCRHVRGDLWDSWYSILFFFLSLGQERGRLCSHYLWLLCHCCHCFAQGCKIIIPGWLHPYSAFNQSYWDRNMQHCTLYIFCIFLDTCASPNHQFYWATPHIPWNQHFCGFVYQWSTLEMQDQIHHQSYSHEKNWRPRSHGCVLSYGVLCLEQWWVVTHQPGKHHHIEKCDCQDHTTAGELAVMSRLSFGVASQRAF